MSGSLDEEVWSVGYGCPEGARVAKGTESGHQIQHSRVSKEDLANGVAWYCDV